MKQIWSSLREIRRDLNRSIFVGERYEKNARGIVLGALLIIVVNAITCVMNWRNGFIGATVGGAVLIAASSLMIFFILVRKDRKTAVTIGMAAVLLTYTYDAVLANNGIVIYWTLLLPMAFCYFASVRHGMALSFYFLTLYWVLFYTPLLPLSKAQYDPIEIERFPILYLADVVLTTYIMVQYHENTLHQMDYAGQLLEAKEAADRANAAKSDFLANMSHEIRTPINAVLGMNEMILRESAWARELPDSEREAVRQALENIGVYASDVGSAGGNLLAIINDVLDFSKIEAGRLDILERPYQLSSLVNDVSNMIFFKAKDKGLDFAVDVDGALPNGLSGDEVRVRQVITNVLSNAVKYTERGSVRLTLRAADGAGAASGRCIRLAIEVRDTGIGIRPEDREKLFNKFERLDLKQNSTVEGTGLGLVITRRLLELMGGSIAVESEYGRGSVFTITLPQRVVSTEPVGDFQKRFLTNVKERAAYRESFHAPEARVLIVDDTRMNLTVAAGLLKNTGMRIDTALSGAEAVELAQRTAYDIILMDQRMPEMDGTEALHRIRGVQDGPNTDTPVICLTADAVIGAKERYLAEGFSDYLTKPIDSRALESSMIRYLPAEKVALVRADVGGAPERAAEADAEDGFAPLRAAGLDTHSGLRYCRGETEFYRSLLLDFANGAQEKTESLRRCLDASDWSGYAIRVHALKSTARTIGAIELAERAGRLEAEANEEDAEALRAEHDAMIEQYAAVTRSIRACLPEAGMPLGEPEVMEFPPEEDGVLEFLPAEDAT